MTLPIIFHPEAQAELDDAYAWYDGQLPGLGEAFLAAVREVLERVQECPEMYSSIYRDVRRGLTRRFPYGVLYRVQAGSIVVLAVFHGSRDPRVWQQRV